jgi:hypothetical protein
VVVGAINMNREIAVEKNNTELRASAHFLHLYMQKWLLLSNQFYKYIE